MYPADAILFDCDCPNKRIRHSVQYRIVSSKYRVLRQSLKAASERRGNRNIPLFISIDQEGGKDRLKAALAGFPNSPSAAHSAKLTTPIPLALAPQSIRTQTLT